jgi:peptidoglycan/LPS O-acetylase OafA/YrhL
MNSIGLDVNDSAANQTGHKLGYVRELDGVRGIAILLVMGNHLSLRNNYTRPLLPGGFVGVDLFFVLSGFLITTLLLQEFDNTRSISLRKFYLRRALRLGPALVAFLMVFCVLSFALYNHAQARGNCFNALIALFYVSNWVRVFTSNQLGLLAHTWSLSVEEQFYLLWPIILLVLLRLSKRRRYIIIVAAVVTFFSWGANFHFVQRALVHPRAGLHLCFGLECRMSALMLGCILGVVMSSKSISEKSKKIIQKFLVVMVPVALAFLITFAIGAYHIGQSFFYYGFWFIAVTIGCVLAGILSSEFLTDNAKRIVRKLLLVVAPVALVCLIGFAIFCYWSNMTFYYFGFGAIAIVSATLILDVIIRPQSLIKRVLAMRWLVWLGSISYGLYLWHYPIFAGMEGFGFKGWTVVLVGMPLTFLMVLISYYAMEKPILKWKKRFSSNEPQPDKSLQASATAPSILTGPLSSQ